MYEVAVRFSKDDGTGTIIMRVNTNEPIVYAASLVDEYHGELIGLRKIDHNE